MGSKRVSGHERQSGLNGGEATIQLLVGHDQNRRMLAEQLADQHQVIDTEPEDLQSTEYDSCIVDARAFENYREDILAKKRAEQPVFLPVVILLDRQDVDRMPDEVWDVVDEILVTPLTPSELKHRLDNLLERRRLSVDLKQRKERSEERFRALFETAPDPIVVTSSDGEITDANDVFGRIVGKSSEELIGKSITDVGFYPKESVERILLRVTDSDEVGVSESNAVQLDTEGDESLITELNADVVTALGEASERIGIFRDVTEREKREEELRTQNERLEEFAATIAHDLRNPLSIAKGHLDLARETGNEQYFDTIAGAHERMEQLIDEILTLARQGQLVMDPEPVSLGRIAKSAWQNTTTKDATLSIETDGEISVDEGRLLEAFENLFRNAVEHGGPSVSVGVGLIDAENPTGFYVEDDGPGIPEKDRDEVFEAGYTSAEDGTGFGLSIVRQIAEGHGWDVSATESADDGARFAFKGVELEPYSV